MSCMWFALASLAAVTVADTDLADSIKTQLESLPVFKAPMELKKVTLGWRKTGQPDRIIAVLSEGTATNSNLKVTLENQEEGTGSEEYDPENDNLSFFNVVWDTKYNFKKVLVYGEAVPEWNYFNDNSIGNSSDPLFFPNKIDVMLEVKDCKLTEIRVNCRADEGKCTTCKHESLVHMDRYHIAQKFIEDFKKKIEDAVTAAAGSLAELIFDCKM